MVVLCHVILEIIFVQICVRVVLTYSYVHMLMLLCVCNILVGNVLVCTYCRCHTSTVPEGAVGVGMWVFCFKYTSFKLYDYAYDVCDRSPLDVLQSTNGPGHMHTMYIVGGYHIRLK